jgi:hypothetical protein
MKHFIFKPLNKLSKHVNGTSCQCYLQASYQDIVDAFDSPLKPVDQYKSSAEWHIEVYLDDELLGLVAIYDYKSHIGYRSDGKETKDITTWHVGAKDMHVAATVVNLITTNIKYNDKKLQTHIT